MLLYVARSIVVDTFCSKNRTISFIISSISRKFGHFDHSFYPMLTIFWTTSVVLTKWIQLPASLSSHADPLMLFPHKRQTQHNSSLRMGLLFSWDQRFPNPLLVYSPKFLDSFAGVIWTLMHYLKNVPVTSSSLLLDFPYFVNIIDKEALLNALQDLQRNCWKKCNLVSLVTEPSCQWTFAILLLWWQLFWTPFHQKPLREIHYGFNKLAPLSKLNQSRQQDTSSMEKAN